VKPTAKNALIGIIVFCFLVWAMKLSYWDVVFYLIVGGVVYFISGVWYKGKKKK
jgi:hypothetical protein